MNKDVIGKLIGLTQEMTSLLESLNEDNNIKTEQKEHHLPNQLENVYIRYDGMTHAVLMGPIMGLYIEDIDDSGNEYNISISELCIKKFPSIRLSDILNEDGWFKSEGSCNGIECISCDSSLMWDYDEEKDAYIPNDNNRLAHIALQIAVHNYNMTHQELVDLMYQVHFPPTSALPIQLCLGKDFND